MSRIANRRALLVAVQSLVKTNAPDEHLLMGAANALAQVISDDTGIDCKLVLKMSPPGIAAARQGGGQAS